MTRINFSAQEIGAFLFTTAWSCGPSQLFGCIKLIVDLYLFKINHNRRIEINSTIQKIQEDWTQFKTTSTISLIAKKLSKNENDLTQEEAENYFRSKSRKIENKIKKLSRLIRADAYFLIPLAGAYLSWRFATDGKGKGFTSIPSHITERLFENFKTFASAPLFMDRKSKKENVSKGAAINVCTSTKNRKIEIFHRPSEKYKKGKRISNEWSPDRLKGPTVVLFHPNAGTGKEMDKSGEFYRDKGYNTLSVTIGGYEGSPGVTSSEKSMYQDIEAIKIYLSSIGVTQVAYHGFSLGSGAAFQAAAGDSLVKNLQTLFVAVDQPYTSVADIGSNVAGFLGRGFQNAACPIDLEVELPGGLWTKTDGLNNLKKITQLKDANIPLFCIERTQDSLMGRNKKNGEYTENFAQDLIAARYGNAEERDHHLIKLEGNHGPNSLRIAPFWSNPKIIPDASTFPYLERTQFGFY